MTSALQRARVGRSSPSLPPDRLAALPFRLVARRQRAPPPRPYPSPPHKLKQKLVSPPLRTIAIALGSMSHCAAQRRCRRCNSSHRSRSHRAHKVTTEWSFTSSYRSHHEGSRNRCPLSCRFLRERLREGHHLQPLPIPGFITTSSAPSPCPSMPP
jgi:hypothetical protein